MSLYQFARKLALKTKPGNLIFYLKNNAKLIDDVQPDYYLSIAACVKDEGRYLREWIEYHLWAGVEHFYIYDNGSQDNTREVLDPYMQSGVVTYRYWVAEIKSGGQQVRMYNDAAVRYRHCTKWLAFIDADEFITLTSEGKRLYGTGGAYQLL